MNVQIRKREFRQKTYTTYTEPASALKTLSSRGVGSVEPTDIAAKTYTSGHRTYTVGAPSFFPASLRVQS